ncbi:MAG: hypothetical protein QXG10_02430 [Candidatus Hadarchaeales archaeon]
MLKRGARALVELLLMVGFFYFLISGSLTVALNNTSFWMAVTSNSMRHSGEDWRLDYSSLGYDTSSFPMQGGFERGDLLIVQGVGSPSQISVGDVVIVDLGADRLPLVHRVIDMWEENGEIRIRTKGDANFASLPGEISIEPERIIGRAVFVIPKIGHIFLWVQGR